MALFSSRTTTRFDEDDVADPQKLLRSLNEFASEVSARFAPVESLGRVAVLDDIQLTLGTDEGPGVTAFPIVVATPFSVAGAWICFWENLNYGEAHILSSTATTLVARPISDTANGGGPALEILYIFGLPDSERVRVRIAVVGVKNG